MARCLAVDACGQQMTTLLHFVPDLTGTTIIVSSGATKPTPRPGG